MSKKTCKLIISSGNDYAIAVKDNQPTLHRHIKRIAAFHKPVSRHIETEKTRNQFTTRTVEVFDDLTAINCQWTGIKSLIRVERVGTRTGKAYRQVVCYISSIVATAKEFAHGIRGHWGIENRLHWVKDVVLNEDNSTIRMGKALNYASDAFGKASPTHSTYFVEMVILPSQLPKDLSLMILTNSFILWNESALPLTPLFKGGTGIRASQFMGGWGINNVLLWTKGLLKHPLKSDSYIMLILMESESRQNIEKKLRI